MGIRHGHNVDSVLRALLHVANLGNLEFAKVSIGIVSFSILLLCVLSITPPVRKGGDEVGPVENQIPLPGPGRLKKLYNVWKGFGI